MWLVGGMLKDDNNFCQVEMSTIYYYCIQSDRQSNSRVIESSQVVTIRRILQARERGILVDYIAHRVS